MSCHGSFDQGNKAQTLVGYSHGTRVSTGGPVTAVTWVFSLGYSGGRGVGKKTRKRCNDTGLAVSWMGHDRLPAPGTAEGALGLPVPQRGERKGCGGALGPEFGTGRQKARLRAPRTAR